MRWIVLLGLVAVARAEIGADCTTDGDCEAEETCAKMIKPGSDEIPEMGKCHNKMDEYELCLMDSQCVDGLTCTKHPLIETPLPILGVCSMCTSDNDCSNSEYCDHPIMNLMCLETLGYFEMLGKKKEKAEKAKMMMFMKMLQDGPPGGEDGPPGPPGGPPGQGRNPRFPNFPVMNNRRNGREKRGVGHWVLNGPTLRCMAKLSDNSPCRRSEQCSSGTCSIEGLCQ